VTPQPGIFASGTPEHCYLELDLRPGHTAEELARALAGLAEPFATTSGVNVVVGLRPELWTGLGDGPPDAAGWTEDLAGVDGFGMPATQHDAWVWIAGADRTLVFDNGRLVIQRLRDLTAVATELTGWHYRHDRDLTGFIDGTENPSLLEARAVACVAEGEPGAGSSVVLVQKWVHDQTGWEALTQREQELAMGRTKPDSIELDDATMPATAHVARTKLVLDGEEQKIFRRNVAYGGVTEHGTVFVGFAARQWRLAEMLRRMAGAADGIRCALTRYLTPVTGAYYTVPPVEALAAYAPPDED
jgi:putative iron-dependent peroxidase